MDRKDRKEVDDYFRDTPRWAITLVIVGLLAAFVGMQGSFGVAVIGLGMAGAGAYVLYAGLNRPADEVIDRLLASDVERLKQRALTKTMIEDEGPLRRDAVVVYAPRLRGLAGAKWGARKGKDGKGRFTPLNVTILNFAENQLSAYQCALDLRTGMALQENTHEYYYQDIVSVQTSTSSETIAANDLDPTSRGIAQRAGIVQNGAVSLRHSESFSLTSSGGTSISMVLPSPELLQSLGGDDFGSTYADEAVNAVRRILREKKSSAIPPRSPADF